MWRIESNYKNKKRTTVRESRFRRMRRRARKVDAWGSLHDYVERKSHKSSETGHDATAIVSTPNQRNTEISVKPESFIYKFAARRDQNAQHDQSNIDLSVLGAKHQMTEANEPSPSKEESLSQPTDADEALNDTTTEVPTPQTVQKIMRTEMTRSWEGHGPSWYIHCCVAGHPNQHEWRQQIAKMRTVRPSIITLQLLMRREALKLAKTDTRRSILDLLPRGNQRVQLIRKMNALGITRQALRSAGDVLGQSSDDERCGLFLAQEGPKPIWLLNFLLRPASTIQDPQKLGDLIAYCTATYCGPEQPELSDTAVYLNKRRRRALLEIYPEDVAHLVLLLAMRAMVVDARLLPKIAELASRYIQSMDKAEDKHPGEIFYDQCGLFNAALAAFRPSRQRLPPTFYRWVPAYWEAQKILLDMSTNLPRQLLVDKLGYRAVREVLSSLDKNQKDIHNSLRHRQSWPPYLEPSDGIDEASEPDANWSRSVSAGTLQQESGFHLDQQDEVLDILQGRGPDMKPTIQQRVIQAPHPEARPWEASIRATRNIQEAWDIFRNPPAPGMKPGPHEYGAMLTKLLTPRARVDGTELPGDSALNYPGKEDPNLTEFEKNRMKAPTAAQLQRQMLRNKIRPTGAMLNMLVSSNKRSRRRLKTVLRLSGFGTDRYLPLLAGQTSGYKGLQQVPLSLFVAFIQHISSLRPVSPQMLVRAMHMTEARFSHDDEGLPWAQYCWGNLLKACGRRPADGRDLTASLVPQINTYHYIVSAMEKAGYLRQPQVLTFATCAQKAARRILSVFHMSVEDENTWESSPLRGLYGHEDHRNSLETRMDGVASEHIPMLRSVHHMGERLKDMVAELIEREHEVRKALDGHWTDSLDGMKGRGDPVQGGAAQALTWTWAFLGEYEEMARYIEWLVAQWDSSTIRDELLQHTYVPAHANFTKMLCIFRRYAEPMLPTERVDALRRRMEDAELAWEWPGADTIDAELGYSKLHYTRLLHAQQWTRYWQAKQRNEEMSNIMRPKRWEEYGTVRRPWYDSEDAREKQSPTDHLYVRF